LPLGRNNLVIEFDRDVQKTNRAYPTASFYINQLRFMDFIEL
jgi:hypothetical protein